MDAATHAGLAYAFTGLLRAFALHASRGQLYVPLDIAKRHGVKPKDDLAGHPTAELAATLADMRAIARDRYDDSAGIGVAAERRARLPPGRARSALSLAPGARPLRPVPARRSAAMAPAMDAVARRAADLMISYQEQQSACVTGSQDPGASYAGA